MDAQFGMKVHVVKGKHYKGFNYESHFGTVPLDRLRKELLNSRWVLLKNIDLDYFYILVNQNLFAGKKFKISSMFFLMRSVYWALSGLSVFIWNSDQLLMYGFPYLMPGSLGTCFPIINREEKEGSAQLQVSFLKKCWCSFYNFVC